MISRLGQVNDLIGTSGHSDGPTKIKLLFKAGQSDYILGWVMKQVVLLGLDTPRIVICKFKTIKLRALRMVTN